MATKPYKVNDVDWIFVETADVTPFVPSTNPRVTDGAVASFTLVKPSPITDGRVISLAAGDDASMATGIAVQTAAGAGVTIQVAELHGQLVAIRSDGAAAVIPGDPIGASQTIGGRCTKITAGNMIGRAFSTAPAVVDALVNVFFASGSIT